MLNATSFRDAEGGQIKTMTDCWNVPDVASGAIMNALVNHSEKLQRNHYKT